MKKFNKILLVGLSAISLVACDEVVARPGNVVNNDFLVEFGGGKNDYYDNDFEVIYDQLIDSGTSNSTILNSIITEIAKNEVAKFYGLTKDQFNTVLDNVTKILAHKSSEVTAYTDDIKASAESLQQIILEEVQDKMIEKAKEDAYNVDYYFQEEKLVNDLRSSLYDIIGDEFTTDYLITPESTYDDIFKADYTDYIEKEIYPVYLKTLLTSVFIYNRNFSSIGRSFARDAYYIKLSTITDHEGAVPMLINSYFNAYINGETPTGSFDLESMSRIYNGVYDDAELENPDSVDYKEHEFAVSNDLFTKADEMAEDISQVATYEDGKYHFLSDTNPNYNESLASEFTGSFSYPLEWGITLKERQLQTSEIYVNDGLVIKSGGYSSLPSDISTRLFSSQVQRNVVTVTGKDGSTVQLLAPATSPNDPAENDYSSQYAIYDAGTTAYYIVVVNDYYNNTSFKDGANAEVAKEIARTLGTSDTNQSEAITYYLDYYDLEFHDQDFYDYVESTYPNVMDDKYHYGE